MKKLLKTIVTILAWCALFAALASFGFASDNPKLGVPLFLVFFLIVFGLVYLYISKHKHTEEISSEKRQIIHKIFGLILILIALLSPYLVLKSAKFSFFVYAIITVIAAILVVLSAFAISIINNSKGKNFVTRFLGYLMLIVISAIPAFTMIQYDSSYNALGTAYYTAILIAIFSWWGFSLFTKND